MYKDCRMKKYEMWSPGSVLATRRILRFLQVRKPPMMTFSAQRYLPTNNNICLKLLRMLHCCIALHDYLPLFLDQSKAAKRLSRLRIYFFVFFLCDHLLISRRNLIFFLWTSWLYSLMLPIIFLIYPISCSFFVSFIIWIFSLFSFCEFAYIPDLSLRASCIFHQRRFIVTFKPDVRINFYFIFSPDIYAKFAHTRTHTQI